MVKRNGHLLYAGNVAPGSGSGGQIVVDRHLRRLAAEGWKITAIVPSIRRPTQGPWRTIMLPQRRWWWPPFRPASPRITRLRELAWRLEIHRVKVRRADAVLTVCPGPMSWLATSLAHSWRSPLLALIHDHWAECGTANDAQIASHVCHQASGLLAVSEEMRASLASDFGTAKVSILPPLSAARDLPFATWREDHARAPVLAHVGALHPYHAPFLHRVAHALATVGGRLLVLCPDDNPVLAKLRTDVLGLWHQPFFPTNTEALRFIAANATGLIVMYPFAPGGPHPSPTGFPSRFVEFTQLGLPVLVAAPPGNPLRTWAERNRWPTQFSPEDDMALTRTCCALSQRESWEICARAARSAATGPLDPDRIHAQFASLLAQLIERSG